MQLTVYHWQTKKYIINNFIMLEYLCRVFVFITVHLYILYNNIQSITRRIFIYFFFFCQYLIPLDENALSLPSLLIIFV